MKYYYKWETNKGLIQEYRCTELKESWDSRTKYYVAFRSSGTSKFEHYQKIDEMIKYGEYKTKLSTYTLINKEEYEWRMIK